MQAQEVGRLMIDLGIIDARFLTLPWYQYPAESFGFENLEFAVRTNANLKTIKIAIDNTGMLELRINPNHTWAMIKDTVYSYYPWCVEQQSKILMHFDVLTYTLQKSNRFADNDLIYIWGLPFLLEIDELQPCDEVSVKAPDQIIPALVPKGRSRYADKYAYLLRKGYINKQALYTLPIFNQGRLIMPKHSLWHNFNFFDREQIAKAATVTSSFDDFVPSSRQSQQEQNIISATLLIDHEAHRAQQGRFLSEVDKDPLDNFYLEQFARLLKSSQDSIFNHTLFSSRMLSDPQRIVTEAIIKPFTDRATLNSQERDDISTAMILAETTLSPCYKTVLKHSIDNLVDDYPYDPFLAIDLKNVLKLDDLPFTFSLYKNVMSQVGVRSDTLPARLVIFGSKNHNFLLEREALMLSKGKTPPYLAVVPPMRDFLSMGKQTLSNYVQQHLSFYKTGKFDPKDTWNLREQELTFFTVDGFELDPSFALIAYLPDVPQSANNIHHLSQAMIDGTTCDTLRPTLATQLLATKRNQDSVAYFAKTLAKPGVLQVKMRGKQSRERVQSLLEEYFKQEILSVASPMAEKLKAHFVACYHETHKHYRLDPLTWLNKLSVKKMKPLGQCLKRSDFAEIRLNLQLVHYPVNVLSSVLIHELCHLVKCNHSDAFKYMLSLFCPNAEAVSNSLINLGIIPISSQKPRMARLSSKQKQAQQQMQESGATPDEQTPKDISSPVIERAPEAMSDKATQTTKETKEASAIEQAPKATAKEESFSSLAPAFMGQAPKEQAYSEDVYEIPAVLQPPQAPVANQAPAAPQVAAPPKAKAPLPQAVPAPQAIIDPAPIAIKEPAVAIAPAEPVKSVALEAQAKRLKSPPSSRAKKAAVSEESEFKQAQLQGLDI